MTLEQQHAQQLLAVPGALYVVLDNDSYGIYECSGEEDIEDEGNWYHNCNPRQLLVAIAEAQGIECRPC